MQYGTYPARSVATLGPHPRYTYGHPSPPRPYPPYPVTCTGTGEYSMGYGMLYGRGWGVYGGNALAGTLYTLEPPHPGYGTCWGPLSSGGTGGGSPGYPHGRGGINRHSPPLVGTGSLPPRVYTAYTLPYPGTMGDITRYLTWYYRCCWYSMGSGCPICIPPCLDH